MKSPPPLCFVYAASRPVTFNKYAFIVLYSIVEAQILHLAPSTPVWNIFLIKPLFIYLIGIKRRQG